MQFSKYILLVVIGVSIVAGLMLSVGEFPRAELLAFVAEHRFVGAVLFALLMCGATVLAPIALLPLVPLIAPVLGPFTTAIACIIGWTVGAVIAFLIARYGGRPLVAQYIPLATLSAYEARIPENAHPLFLIFLRMMIPVDVLSYVLGLVSTVTLFEYTYTTLIGVSWFSFVFAYSGDALYTRNYVLLGSIGVASVFILLIATRYIRRRMGR